MMYLPVKRENITGDFLHSREWQEIRRENRKKIGDTYYEPVEIPCGKCIGCRLDKSREWALRCMMELKYYDVASFLTLTYNENKVPICYTSDPDTGLAIPVLSLRKRDLQLFWKRLRKELGDCKIRYFACGEYGKETWRPHYHAIVFGYRPADLVVVKNNENGNYWKSDSLNRIWSNGNVIVANVDFNTCAYVARYTAKKTVGTLGDEFYQKFNIEPPFLAMSRRPGIGWQYMEDNPQVFRGDHIYLSGPDPIDGSIPRNFVKKIEESDPDLYRKVKEQRKFRGDVYERALTMAHKVPYSKLLEDSEANLLAKSRGIIRNKI